MTESQTPSILLPIGRDAGPRFVDGTAEPEYRIMIGDGFQSLGQTEYSVWRLAHGVPNHRGLWKRENTIAAAAAEGIRDADTVIDQLCSARLLQELRLGGDDVLNFSVLYRPVPLVLGMTALVGGTERHAVAVRERVLAEISDVAYHVFIWAALFDDLWSNCERLSQQAARGAISLGVDSSSGGALALFFLTECHSLLAVQALSFDMDPAVWEAEQSTIAGAA